MSSPADKPPPASSTIDITLTVEADTQHLAEAIGASALAGDLILLFGELGAAFAINWIASFPHEWYYQRTYIITCAYRHCFELFHQIFQVLNAID